MWGLKVRVLLGQHDVAPQIRPSGRAWGVAVSERRSGAYYVGARVTQFDAATGTGTLPWDRRPPAYSFNKSDRALVGAGPSEFLPTEYDRDPALPFASPRTVRVAGGRLTSPADGAEGWRVAQ